MPAKGRLRSVRYTAAETAVSLSPVQFARPLDLPRLPADVHLLAARGA